MYCTKEDLKVLITDEELAALGTTSEINTALQIAEEDAFAYLQHYDVVNIKKQTADERSKKLVLVIGDLALYILISKSQLSQIPEQREKRYEEATQWLNMVARGILLADLPKKEAQKSVYWSSYKPLGEFN